MTSIDEYRKVICLITDEECQGCDCSECEDASKHGHTERMEEHASLLPEKEAVKKSTTFLRNSFNTVAEFNPNVTIEKIIEIFQFPDKSIKPVPYDMRRLIIRWPQFIKVKNILSLGIPYKMVEISDYLIAYYEHKTLVTAPRLTDKEFNEKSR